MRNVSRYRALPLALHTKIPENAKNVKTLKLVESCFLPFYDIRTTHQPNVTHTHNPTTQTEEQVWYRHSLILNNLDGDAQEQMYCKKPVTKIAPVFRPLPPQTGRMLHGCPVTT